MPFEPQFISLSDKPPLARFALLHWPSGPQVPKGLVVHAPAFAEEMNKSRRMVALQARALAQDGLAVLVVDPLGCGDSPGDFGEATWEQWVQDVAQSMVWLRREFALRWPTLPEPVRVLWGLRAGALLAAAAARRTPGPCALLLWQPAMQGRQVLQQFLRLLSAGELLAGKGQGAVAAAKAGLAAGQAQDVGGYRVSPGMAQGLEQSTLEPAPAPASLFAFELSSRDDPTLTPALQNNLASWQGAGWQTVATVVAGPSFWQTTEIEEAPALVDATCQALKGLCGGGAPATARPERLANPAHVQSS